MTILERLARAWSWVRGVRTPSALPERLAGPQPELSAGAKTPQSVGRYRITATIRPWRHGWLFRAHGPTMRREVMLETLSPEAARFPEFARRFTDGAWLTARLNHPGIVTVYELGEERDGTKYIAYEALDGERLSNALGRRLSLAEGAPLVLQLLNALAWMHEAGVVHRDLTPDGVFVCTGGFAKIFEFEVAARISPERRRTDSAPVHNSAFYIAPEQVRHQDVDPRCDLFSVGCILYEMVAGQLPFIGASVSEVSRAILTNEPDWEALPSGAACQPMREVIRRALEKDPEDRFPDAATMRSALESAYAELGQSASWTPPSHSIPALRPD